MSETLTRSLGAFVSELRLAAIPADALSVVHTGFADCVGTMIAGSVEDRRSPVAGAGAPPGDVNLYLVGPRVPAPEAAWIQAARPPTRSTTTTWRCAPPRVPSGAGDPGRGQSLKDQRAQMATAYVAGYEVWADLQRRDPQQHHEKGWHPTGIFGAIGAAAACASLRGLDAGRPPPRLRSAPRRRRPGVELRHHGQTLPPGGRRTRASSRRAWPPPASPRRPMHWSPLGFPAAVSPRAMSTAARRASRARLEHPHPGSQREEVSAVLLHAQGHRRRPRPAARPEDRARRREGDHRLDQPAQHQDPPQQPAADRARGQVQHAVRHGERDRGQARRAHRADRHVRAGQGHPGPDAQGRGGARRREDPTGWVPPLRPW